MGKKAKVQIQKAKPEKETSGPSLSRCYQWKEEKKKLATEEELAVGKDTTWNRGHSAFHEHGKQKYFGDMQNQEDKYSKGCFSYFCDVVKEGGTGWNWAGQRCPRGSRVWPTEKLWALISLQSLCVGHKHVKKLSVEQRCSNILSQCASEWNPKERVGKTGFVHLRIVWPWFGNNLDLISKCLKCELGFINWKIWKLSRVSGGKWKCAGQDRCYLIWPDMLLATANSVVYLAKLGSMCSLKRWSGKGCIWS